MANETPQDGINAADAAQKELELDIAKRNRATYSDLISKDDRTVSLETRERWATNYDRWDVKVKMLEGGKHPEL